MNIKALHIKALIFVLFCLSYLSYSQKVDKDKVVSHFDGAITLTNKGISTIPSFTLGKPAVVFDLSLRKDKLIFEPQFRFSLEGKPWTFLFWWRYKLIESEKFKINMGAHPALSFKTIQVTTNGESKEIMVAHRYLAGELAPNYLLTNNLSVGVYYLYSHGLEKEITKHTHFLALRSNLSGIKLSDQLFMRFNPQIYYLKADEKDGFYVTATLSLAKRNFPISISSILNKTIKSEVPASKDFIWNVSLIYSFHKIYNKIL